ncbi:hypothetical protein QUH73_10695 [Labilibaculum sp. K2S]|uniref:hypothetical protein n=1 Tax=Labilibaculum sp. K2S TaxID=3056386 RepID=UPI0025A3347B|nr:hypothetical protein [Labilibaculum sp. K2S]MDM8160282.1 hypothetical protein [Labilibaculum sp. K2S]
MTYLFLLLLTVSFLLILTIEYKLKSVSLVLWGGLSVFFLLPHAVDIFLGPPQYTIETYNKASLFAFIFNIFYLGTRLFLTNSKNVCLLSLNVTKSKNFNNSYISTLFILLLISFTFLLYFVITTFGGFFNFSWIDMFDKRGGFSYNMFSYLFAMCSPLPFVAHIYKKKFVFFSTLIILLIIIFLFRIRTFLIPLTIPFVVSYLLSDKFKINIFNLFKTLIISFTTIILIVGLGVLKAFASLSDFYNSITLNEFSEMLYSILFSKYGELGLRNAFYFYLENDNQFANFGLGLGYIRLFLLPIPSFMSLGIKPQDFAMDMAMAYDPINSTAGVNSMHPTLYGDCYANLGWFGVLLGIFWAFFVFVGDRLTISTSKNIIFISLFVAYSYTYTLIARGAIYNAVYNVFFILLTHCILALIIRSVKKL